MTGPRPNLIAVVGVVAALLGAACSTPSQRQPDAGDTVGEPLPIVLIPTDTGFVMDGTSGVVGAWYAYGDGVGPNANATTTDQMHSDCIAKGGFQPSDCTQIATPTPGQAFVPDAMTGGMCTSGVAAKVLAGPSGSFDYADLWGGGIALDLNNPGGDAGVKSTFDLSRYTGISFGFSGAQIPVGKVRVNFPFLGEHGQDSPYYKGATIDNSMLTNNAIVTIRWADVGGPAYLLSQMPAVTPPPFDPTQVFSIQWQVFTNTSTATPYQFCVTNLALLP
jgi:hypothetical protein